MEMEKVTGNDSARRMRLWQIQTTLYLVAVLFLVSELLFASQETLRVARQVRNALYHSRPESAPPAASPFPSSSSSSSSPSSPKS